jgi:hypothetical protein
VTPAIHQYTIALVVYWLLMIPIAAYILHAVALYFTDDAPPTFRRAVLLVLVTAAVVFFSYDVSGYIFARMMQDPTAGIALPPGYTYWDWLGEPLALKWQALGLVPFVRYLPVLFAFLAGGIAQTVLWKVEFRLGFVVFLVQAGLTITAMAILSMLFRFVLSYTVELPPPTPAAEVRPDRTERAPAPANLREFVERCDEQQGNPDSFWRRLDARRESVNVHLAPLYRLLQPITNHLPNPAQDFLNSGGWLLVIAGAGGLIAFRRRIHRNRKQLVQPRAKRRPATPRIELAMIGDSLTYLGPRQATVQGVPARLRLVVMAPDAAATGAVAVPAPMDQFLNTIHADLSSLSAADFPRADVWSDAEARTEFRKACEGRLEFPANTEQAAHWVVLMGTTTWHGLPTQVALGFYSSGSHAHRFLEVPTDGWAEIIGSRDVPKDERL